MDQNITVHKELHLLIDQYISKLDECLDQNEAVKSKVYLEVIKRSCAISQWIRNIALNFIHHKCSGITISDADITSKIHGLVENSLRQDLLESAIDAQVSSNASPTNDDLHNILFFYAIDDPNSVAPSLKCQLTCNLFENKLLSCCSVQNIFPSVGCNDVSHMTDEFGLSSCFEKSRRLFENDLSELKSSLGTDLSAVDLKINETSAKTEEKSLNNSSGINRLSEVRKEPTRIKDWLLSYAFPDDESGNLFDRIEGLQNIHSNTFSWEGRMRQEIPCHLYTSELNEKEVLLNTNEGDAEKFCMLFDSSEVLSEQDFVYDVLDLLLGIPSNTFLYDEKEKVFRMKSFTRLARISSESTCQFCEPFIECGTAFHKLKTFCSSIQPKEGFTLKGLKDGIYNILTAYMEYITSVKYNTPTMHVVRTDVLESAQKLNSLIEICGLQFEGNTASELPKGLGLLSYLNKVSWLHKTRENALMVAVVFKYVYVPYFSFLNKWMSDGICCDPFNEFQIEEDPKYIDRKDELYWKFTYTENEDDSMRSLPYEIKKFSHDILQCGKTMRLLQNCGVQMFSLDYMTCNTPPSLSMLFSYDAVKCRMAECEQYILDKESFQMNHKKGRDFSEDEFYIRQQIFVDQKNLSEKIERLWNSASVIKPTHDMLDKEHVLKRCVSFPNIAILKEMNSFSGILHKSVGILFTSCIYNPQTVATEDFIAAQKLTSSLDSRKMFQKKEITNCFSAYDKFKVQNTWSTKIISSNAKDESKFSDKTETPSMQETRFPPGSFMDCLLSLLVSEYGDDRESIHLFIQLISLQNLMLYNFRDVLNMRLHLTQNAIMDYVMHQLHFQDLLLCLKNTYFLQDESFSQRLCEKLFKWVIKCSSLGEFADWPILNKILTRSIATPSCAKFPFLESASVNFVPVTEEYLSKRNKFLHFFQFEFEIKWPLNIIVHKACISQYIRIHSLILEMEYLCWRLGKIWRLHFIDAKSEELQMSPQYRKVMLYRFNMHQFVRVLRSCIHQDLGGPLWQSLLKSLNTKELSIDALEDIHLKYLEKALERCFLTQDTHNLHEILELLFKQVNIFCDAASSASWKRNSDSNCFESSSFQLLSDYYNRYIKCRDRFYEFIWNILSKMITRKKLKPTWDEHYKLYLETVLESGKGYS